MDTTSSTVSIFFQVVITFIVLFVIYMIYALLGLLEIDMIAGIGYLIFQPILGFVFTSLTILACLLLGLPIRLIKGVRQFWLSKPLLPLTGFFAGIVSMLLAYNSHFTELKEVTLDFGTIQKEVPEIRLAIAGWFVTGFSLLHFYPQSLQKFIRGRKKQ